jgi:hypothetical protein
MNSSALNGSLEDETNEGSLVETLDYNNPT